MDEWDLDPSPRTDTRLPETHVEEPEAATVASEAAQPPVAPTDGARTGSSFGAGSRAARAGPRRRRVVSVLTWVAAGVVLLVVGALVGFTIAQSQADDNAAELSRAREEVGLVEKALSRAEERNWNYYRENLALEAQIEAWQSTSSTLTPASEPGAGTTYGDGIYLVGEDIPAGAYDGVVIGEQGYWARLNETDGQVSSIIANAVPREPFVLTIIVSDNAVELRGVEITAR